MIVTNSKEWGFETNSSKCEYYILLGNDPLKQDSLGEFSSVVPEIKLVNLISFFILRSLVTNASITFHTEAKTIVYDRLLERLQNAHSHVASLFILPCYCLHFTENIIFFSICSTFFDLLYSNYSTNEWMTHNGNWQLDPFWLRSSHKESNGS